MALHAARSECTTCLSEWEQNLLTLITDPTSHSPSTNCTVCKRLGLVNPIPEKDGLLMCKITEVQNALSDYDRKIAEANALTDGRFAGYHTAGTITVNGFDLPDTPPFNTPLPIVPDHPYTLRSNLDVSAACIGSVAMGFYETDTGEIEIGVGRIGYITPQVILLEDNTYPLTHSVPNKPTQAECNVIRAEAAYRVGQLKAAEAMASAAVSRSEVVDVDPWGPPPTYSSYPEPPALYRSDDAQIGEIGEGFFEDEDGDVDVGVGVVEEISEETGAVRIQRPARMPGGSLGFR